MKCLLIGVQRIQTGLNGGCSSCRPLAASLLFPSLLLLGGLPWLWCAMVRGNGEGSAAGKGMAAVMDLFFLTFLW